MSNCESPGSGLTYITLIGTPTTAEKINDLKSVFSPNSTIRNEPAISMRIVDHVTSSTNCVPFEIAAGISK